MIGRLEEKRSAPKFGIYEMERYCITYVWDDGELTGITTITNLTLEQAENEMLNLEKAYQTLIKYAVMAKMLEVIK